MATIANMAAKITADGSGFMKTFDNIDARIKKTEKTTGQLGHVFKALKVVAVGLMAIAAGSYVLGAARDTIKGIMEDLQIARKIDDSIGSIQELRFALISVGQPGEDAAKILQNLNTTIANASTGMDSGVAEVLDRIGLSASDLAKKKPYEQLKDIAVAIAAIKDPAARAAAAVQIFGEDAQTLLPLLVQGSKAFDEAAEHVKKFGGALSNAEASELQSILIKADKLQETFKIAAYRIASEIIPFIKMMVDELEKAAETGMSFSDVIKVIGLTAGAWVLFFIEVFRVGKLLFQFAKLGFLGIAKVVIEAVKLMLDVAAELPARLGGREFKAARDAVAGFSTDVSDLMDGTVSDIDKNIDKIGSSLGKLPKMIEDSVKKVRDPLGKDLDKKLGAEGALPLAEKFKGLFAGGKDIFKSVETPLQKYVNRTKELNAALKSGAISWDTYSKATADAVRELEKAHELTNLSSPRALMKNTAEAASSINQNALRERQYREKPEDRVIRVLEQSREIEKKQLAEQKKIAEAAKNIVIVTF